MNKIFVEIIQDRLGTYYANITKNGVLISNIVEYVDYNTLKQDIKNKVSFEILKRKDLIWHNLSGKKGAYIQNYKNDNVGDNESVDCRMIWVDGKLEHYKGGI